MTPLFYLQIVDQEGVVVHIPGGGPLETALIEVCTAHIMSRGVGFFKSETHVEADVRAGLQVALMALKQQTVALVQ